MAWCSIKAQGQITLLYFTLLYFTDIVMKQREGFEQRKVYGHISLPLVPGFAQNSLPSLGLCGGFIRLFFLFFFYFSLI